MRRRLCLPLIVVLVAVMVLGACGTRARVKGTGSHVDWELALPI